jgi:hypothetical protein
MRTVRDDEGTRYLLLKRSGASSLVRDPATGAERYLPNDRLTAVEGTDPLAAAAESVPRPRAGPLSGLPDAQALGLVVDLVDRGPTPAVTLLDAYDRCESDLHGLLGELRAAGLVREATAFGERGYAPTTTATDAVATLRGRRTDRPD